MYYQELCVNIVCVNELPLYLIFPHSIPQQQGSSSDVEKEKRIQASIREREKEVQRTRDEQQRELERERGQYKKEEAIQHFKALLADLVSQKETCLNFFLKISSFPSVVQRL